MIATQAKPATPAENWRKLLKRTVWFLLLVFVLGYGMRHTSAALERNPAPAGFGRGMLQGALIPCALPNLLVGSDVSIYNEHNTGVPYCCSTPSFSTAILVASVIASIWSCVT